MTNFSSTSLSFLDSRNEYFSHHDTDSYLPFNSGMPVDKTSHYDSEKRTYSCLEICLSVLIVIICFFGLVGNGTVIWLLTFCIQKNPFIIFIQNLAVADFGALLFIPLIVILYLLNLFMIFYPYFYLEDLFMYMYTPGQFLLTAISVDRCVSVHFPIWHQCHWSKHFSTIVCVVIWVLSFFLCGIASTFLLIDANSYHDAMAYLSVSIALLCFPLMTISTLTLFIKVCLTSRWHRRGNILTAILLTLLFFLVLAFPFNILFCIFHFSFHPTFSLSIYGFLCASLNSSVNPLIYFLIGRQKKGHYRENMKVILQRVFNEEKECRSQLDPPVQTQL